MPLTPDCFANLIALREKLTEELATSPADLAPIAPALQTLLEALDVVATDPGATTPEDELFLRRRALRFGWPL